MTVSEKTLENVANLNMPYKYVCLFFKIETGVATVHGPLDAEEALKFLEKHPESTCFQLRTAQGNLIHS